MRKVYRPRWMKVGRKSRRSNGGRYAFFPAILLCGQWLDDCGFRQGQQVKVVCKRGCVTIRPVPEEAPSTGRHK